VFEGFDLESGRVVAIKQLPTKGIPVDEVNSLKSEIKLLRNLQVSTSYFLCFGLCYSIAQEYCGICWLL